MLGPKTFSVWKYQVFASLVESPNFESHSLDNKNVMYVKWINLCQRGCNSKYHKCFYETEY